mgnify:FL=1
MGASFSVRFANIYMHQFFTKFFQNANFTKPKFIARLIDDIFFTWDDSRENLDLLISQLNSHHHTIKFEPIVSKDEVHFLDTTVYIDKSDFTMHTKLYRKPTYRVQYLHYQSNHPRHVKRAIPYSQALRYKRIIDDDEILQKELNTLKNYFQQRNYSDKLIDEEIQKIHTIDRQNTLIYKTKEQKRQNFMKFTKDGAFLPLIVTYDPRVAAEIRLTIRDEWIKLLENNQTLRKIFANSTPQIVFKRGRTLANALIKAKYTGGNRISHSGDQELAAESQPRSEPCHKQFCKCCKEIENKNSFKSSTTKKAYELQTPMNCDSENVIYLITCTRCYKQYVGQTERRLKDRLNAHRSNIKRAVNTAVGIHFNNTHHTIGNLRIIPIENVNDQNTRLGREQFWIKELKTKYPLGLNHYPIDNPPRATRS